MKKILLLAYIALSMPVLVASSDTTKLEYSDSYQKSRLETVIDNITYSEVADQADVEMTSPLDSLQIIAIADIAYQIGVKANGGKDFIKGVPNSVLHMLSLPLIGILFHWLGRRRVKRKLLKSNKGG